MGQWQLQTAQQPPEVTMSYQVEYGTHEAICKFQLLLLNALLSLIVVDPSMHIALYFSMRIALYFIWSYYRNIIC